MNSKQLLFIWLVAYFQYLLTIVNKKIINLIGVLYQSRLYIICKLSNLFRNIIAVHISMAVLCDLSDLWRAGSLFYCILSASRQIGFHVQMATIKPPIQRKWSDSGVLFNIRVMPSISYGIIHQTYVILLLLLLLLLLFEVCCARPGESENTLSVQRPQPHTTDPRKEEQEDKIVIDTKERADHANRKALAQLLKPASPTPSNAGPLRSFQRDAERGTKVLRYWEVLQRGDANECLLLLLLKKIGNARPGEGDCHPISPKTPAPHYQP